VVRAAVVFPTVVPAVPVAIRPVITIGPTVTTIVVAPTISVSSLVSDALLEARNSTLNGIRFVRVQAVAANVPKLALDIARFIAEAGSFTLAQNIPLIETIFSLEGIGLLSFESLVNRDYPVVFATVYIFSLMGLAINLLSDLIYMWVDPRIDFETREV